MPPESEPAQLDRKLKSISVSNWILAGTTTLALVSIVFGFAQNRNLQQERNQLRLQLNSVVRAVPCELPRPGDVVPTFAAQTDQGQRIAIDFNGDTRFLLFFISFKCDDCVKQLTEWNEIAKRATDKKVVVLGVAIDDERPVAKLPDHNFEIVTIKDPALVRAYRINATPTIMLVSEQGRIQWVRAGELSASNTQELNSVINGETVIVN